MDDELLDPTDKAVLKRAMKAFRKRLKTFRLDDETNHNRGAFSGGKSSGIVAIKAPDSFPKAIWDELVKQGRLKESNSMYELND